MIILYRRWVFKQLHEKGSAYRGFKVMPFSKACYTSLSNSTLTTPFKTLTSHAHCILTQPSQPRAKP